MQARDLFEILVRENSNMLWAYLRSALFDKQAAEDLYQETMLVAWKRLDDYDRERPFGAWLRGIASHLVLAHIRKSGRRQMALVDGATLDELAHRFDGMDERFTGPWELRLEALGDCLGVLRAEDRTIIEDHYHNNQDCRVIAAATDLSVEAVKKRLQRARASLLECIERKTNQGLRYG